MRLRSMSSHSENSSTAIADSAIVSAGIGKNMLTRHPTSRSTVPMNRNRPRKPKSRLIVVA